VDLNRDFEALSQKESQNVYNFFKQYAFDVDIALDFHNASTEGRSLYYNCINYSVNSVANYKTTNHMYHRLMELGYCKSEPDIATIPGSYEKSDVYIEGRLWNEFKVPTITIEHFTNSTFPNSYTDKGFTLGVETYGNFVIQNALFFMDYNSK
jgi:predicted deacylase